MIVLIWAVKFFLSTAFKFETKQMRLRPGVMWYALTPNIHLAFRHFLAYNLDEMRLYERTGS